MNMLQRYKVEAKKVDDYIYDVIMTDNNNGNEITIAQYLYADEADDYVDGALGALYGLNELKDMEV